MSDAPLLCRKCNVPALAVIRRRLTPLGLKRYFKCRACGATASAGVWSNVLINVAMAAVIVGLGYLKNRSFDGLPKGAIVAPIALIVLAGFEVWRLRQFTATSSAG